MIIKKLLIAILFLNFCGIYSVDLKEQNNWLLARRGCKKVFNFVKHKVYEPLPTNFFSPKQSVINAGKYLCNLQKLIRTPSKGVYSHVWKRVYSAGLFMGVCYSFYNTYGWQKWAKEKIKYAGNLLMMPALKLYKKLNLYQISEVSQKRIGIAQTVLVEGFFYYITLIQFANIANKYFDKIMIT